MGYLEGFGVTLRQHRLFGGKRLTEELLRRPRGQEGPRTARRKHGRSTDRAVAVDTPDDVKMTKPARIHGRHVLNRYEDGMEKCIGCELCAGVCPADCIYVRGADNDPDDPTSPGERFGFVYEINYLRCIHCDLCVEACPTEAITESKLFEFSFTNRRDAIYTKTELRRRRRRPAAARCRGRTGGRATTPTPAAGCAPRRRRATPTSSARSAGAASSATAHAHRRTQPRDTASCERRDRGSDRWAPDRSARAWSGRASARRAGGASRSETRRVSGVFGAIEASST